MRVRKSVVAVCLAVAPLAMNVTPAHAARGVSITDPVRAVVPFAGTYVIEGTMHEDYGDPKCWDGAPLVGECTSLRFFLQTYPNGSSGDPQFAAGAQPAEGDNSSSFVQAACPNGPATQLTLWQTRFEQAAFVASNGMTELDERYSNQVWLSDCPSVPPGILHP